MTSVARPRPRKNGDKSQHNGVLRALRAHVHRPMECVSHPEKYPHTLGMIVIAMRLAATDCRSEIRDQQIKSFTMVPDERQTFSPKEIVDRRSSSSPPTPQPQKKKRHCTRQHREMRAGYRSHRRERVRRFLRWRVKHIALTSYNKCVNARICRAGPRASEDRRKNT